MKPTEAQRRALIQHVVALHWPHDDLYHTEQRGTYMYAGSISNPDGDLADLLRYIAKELAAHDLLEPQPPPQDPTF